MSCVTVSTERELAIVTLERGKVNALNRHTLEELDGAFGRLEKDDSVRAVVLTGSGSFFSFGFDVPELLTYSLDQLREFLTGFTALYTRMFLLPKPLVGALNGHAVAGGCMLATTCDRRVMSAGKGKVSLNEVTFGASVFAGSVMMLVACAGQRNAEEILSSGAMYGAERALELGLVDRVTGGGELLDVAKGEALELAGGDPAAFASIKGLLRGPIAEEMRRREAGSIEEFVQIWTSPATQKQLAEIKIRS
jgi:enoyl-CoA hydratase/carnithine racemase